MEIASPSKTALYLNAFDKNIQVDGVIKTFDDEYWVANIVPILYPLWDSDKDKLEVFVKYKDGTSNKVITVANKIPKAKEIAIGITTCACKLRSKMMGNKPIKVVSDVKIIALNRCEPASIAAFTKEWPSLRARLTKSTMIKLSFTTTPDKAMIPQIDSTLTACPNTRCPTIAPTIPNGITDMMIKGCE